MYKRYCIGIKFQNRGIGGLFFKDCPKGTYPDNPAQIFHLLWSRAWLNPANRYSHGLLDTKR